MNKSFISIAETTLKILEKKQWDKITLDEIKKKSKVKSFDNIVNNKFFIIKNLNHYFDYKMINDCSKIEQSNNKDMIFEVIMMRFDILQRYKKGIRSIFNSFKSKPKNLFFLLPDLLESIILMIGFTKISKTGIIGQLRIKGVFIVYISSFFTWMKDDTPSLEKTMTALDNYLDKAGKLIKYIE